MPKTSKIATSIKANASTKAPAANAPAATTAVDLTPSQRAILGAACARPDGAVFPVTTGPKGGALIKVLAGLAKRGLIVGDADVWFATSAAYAALGLQAPGVPTAADPEADEADAEQDGPIEAPADAKPNIRAGTKQAMLIEMLRRTEGANIGEIMAATGWLSHTVRGAIAGALKKRLGLTVTSDKIEGRGRVYRIAG